MDCSLSGSSVLEIFWARLLERVAISSSRGCSWPRDRIHISCISYTAGRFFTLSHQGSPYIVNYSSWIWGGGGIGREREGKKTLPFLAGKGHEILIKLLTLVLSTTALIVDQTIREDPLEKEMATHSSILAWRIPWTEEPGRLQSTGSQRVGHDWATSLSLFLYVCVCVCIYIYIYIYLETEN